MSPMIPRLVLSFSRILIFAAAVDKRWDLERATRQQRWEFQGEHATEPDCMIAGANGLFAYSFLARQRNVLVVKNEMRSTSSHNNGQQTPEWYVQYVSLLNRTLLTVVRNCTTSAPLAILSSPMCELDVVIATNAIVRNSEEIRSADMCASTDPTKTPDSLIRLDIHPLISVSRVGSVRVY